MAAHHVPELVDDAVEEVLLRCPPDDPARLHRAALVCKRWHRVVSTAAFRRTAQPLGFVCNVIAGYLDMAPFVPTPLSSFRPPRSSTARRKMRAFDARHGRVLLQDMDPWLVSLDKVRLVVWNPITGEHRDVPKLPVVLHSSCWSAAVLCANSSGGCDHLSCHRGHFKVVVVGVHPNYSYVYTCVYYSEPGCVWSTHTAAPQLLHQPGCRFDLNPSVLVGNALQFVFRTHVGTSEIPKYDLATEQMSVVNIPSTGFHSLRGIVLRTMEDGGLGLAIVGQSKLYLWSRVDGSDGLADQWYQSGVIDLEKLVPSIDLLDSPAAVGFAGVGVIFLGTKVGNFVIDMKSNQVTKLDEGARFFNVFPFSSFSIPGPRVGSSSCS